VTRKLFRPGDERPATAANLWSGRVPGHGARPGRGYDDHVDTGPTWPDIAAWYDELVESGSGPHETAVRCTRSLVGDIAGQDVLDIACGPGQATRALAEAGAAGVTGVDSSDEMIEIARGHERARPLGIRYVRDDAQSLSSLPAGRFDGVNCQLGLMDIPDLGATLAAVHRVLRPAGWFAFVIGHPCFLAPEAATVRTADGRPARLISDYFRERFWRSTSPDGVRRVGNHHRTIATYLNCLVRAGFVVDAVDEPRPTASLASQQPEYAAMPIFWATRAHRA
jgi:ubiquinone/menaquinone biosynthesis C-methylase UbiE